MARVFSIAAVILLAVAFFGGCSKSGPKLYPVIGTVTLDGAPLADGIIYFKTVQTGAIDTMPIKDGKFFGRAIEGERRVEIVSYRLIPIAGEMGGEVQESLIDVRFNSESNLVANVTSAGLNEFTFEVTGK